jgi:hypothetical protein
MSVCLSRLSSQWPLSTLLKQCEPRSLLQQLKTTLLQQWPWIPLLLFSILVFIIPLVALKTSSPVMWRKEHLWNFSVLQRVQLSSLVTPYLPVHVQLLHSYIPICVSYTWSCNQNYIINSPTFEQDRKWHYRIRRIKQFFELAQLCSRRNVRCCYDAVIL